MSRKTLAQRIVKSWGTWGVSEEQLSPPWRITSQEIEAIYAVFQPRVERLELEIDELRREIAVLRGLVG